jgi:sulfate transport system ATP-binding protein
VEEGEVEYVLFLGKEVEYGIRVKDVLIKGNRRIEDEPVKRHEKVNVCIYRAYTFQSDGEVSIVGNANIETRESVVI